MGRPLPAVEVSLTVLFHLLFSERTVFQISPKAEHSTYSKYGFRPLGILHQRAGRKIHIWLGCRQRYIHYASTSFFISSTTPRHLHTAIQQMFEGVPVQQGEVNAKLLSRIVRKCLQQRNFSSGRIAKDETQAFI